MGRLVQLPQGLFSLLRISLHNNNILLLGLGNYKILESPVKVMLPADPTMAILRLNVYTKQYARPLEVMVTLGLSLFLECHEGKYVFRYILYTKLERDGRDMTKCPKEGVLAVTWRLKAWTPGKGIIFFGASLQIIDPIA